MRMIEQIYINGGFVTPHGEEMFDLFNPATAQVIGRVRLADAVDVGRAVAAAKQAFPAFSRTGKQERIAILHRLRNCVLARADALTEAAIEEFGAPRSVAAYWPEWSGGLFMAAAQSLEDYALTRRIGTADVVMEPVGVAGLITPWNADALIVCAKLATVVAAGCTCVIKPSEMSAIQTQILTETLHEAGLPAGVFNIVTGRGDVAGAELTRHPDVAKISFTGSTVTGKAILRAGADTIKRMTLELGGKSPTVILDDADLGQAVPLAITAGFLNSGQACTAGSRILVPEHRLAEVSAIARDVVATIKVGDPREADTQIGPMVSLTQWERVQRYIRLGIEEGAAVLIGGEGRPSGLAGYFVKPTVFTNVSNGMTIAREEIFGPVLSIITYRSEEEAIGIANDTPYGLQAYVLSPDAERARRVALRIMAGTVIVNGLQAHPLAPFGGFKQSGLGREMGSFGLDAYFEPKTVMNG
ncbi:MULTISPECIES: aldehyde dehydrogenase family protein [Rhodomicrobium]|uniref:aldehyde dehydrogenase family protein n=1 Tax=Rhodomicrobium TaxID=1068 RepID=UPI000B4B3283|nr:MULTISPECIES: aldehyde dehydrogenase family protein [Rhodomicrobium]